MAAIAQNEGKFNNGTTLSSIFHVLNYNSANFQKCYIKTHAPIFIKVFMEIFPGLSTMKPMPECCLQQYASTIAISH